MKKDKSKEEDEGIFGLEDSSGVGGLPPGNLPVEDEINVDEPKSEPTKERKSEEAPSVVEAGGPPDMGDMPGDDDEVYEEDFTGVDEGGFPFVPKGYYHARVHDMEKNLSQAGNPQYTWQFRIIAGPPEVKGVTLKFWTSLLPQSRWKVVETLEALGIKAAGSIARFHRKDVLGQPCIIQTIEEPYEGRSTAKIQKVFRPNQDTLKAMEKLKEDIPF